MKKFTLILAALIAVAFVAPAFAADNLSLSGTFRVRGWDKKDISYGETDDDDASYFDQRMRIQAKIAASDNAYVVVRTDIAEAVWGRDIVDVGGGWYRANPGTNSNVHFDRAFGVYDNDNFTLTMGLQYFGVGILEVVDGQYTAAKLRLKLGAVEPSLFYGKLDENGDLDDDDADDTNLYAVNLSFGLGGFDANAFGAMVENRETDYDQWAAGFHAAGKMGMVNLVTELAVLGGEMNDAVDYEGIQFYVKAEADLNEAAVVGAEFLWAAGYDDADECQLSNLSDAGDFTIADTNAPSATDVTFVENGPFDFTGDGAGVIGASLFGSYKVMDQLSLGAKFAYLTPEEDDATLVESAASYTAWAAYDLGSNTSIVLLYNIVDPEVEKTSDEEARKILYARFQIAF